MGPNSLDALCKRYGIDNSHRTRHGALLDSGLLAEVYIELIGGKQATFGLDVATTVRSRQADLDAGVTLAVRLEPLPPRLTPAARAAHAALVATLGEKALWLKPQFRQSMAAPPQDGEVQIDILKVDIESGTTQVEITEIDIRVDVATD